MKKYIEPKVKHIALASEETMAAASLQLSAEKPIEDASEILSKEMTTSTSVWDE